jgi:predicted  nucleic acid-binding Zn-ribbon protein
MTGTEAVGLIPTPAWVQAVFVCLFFLFVIYITSHNSRQGKESRDFQKAESDGNREFQKQESDKWQKFIGDLNASWQKFNKEQREENNSCMSDVNAGLSNLTQVTQGLVQEVREMRTESREISAALALHDNQAKEILHHVQANGKPVAKPHIRASS